MILVKILSFIAALMAILYLAIRAFRKHAQNLSPKSTSKLSIVEYRKLDQKTTLCLIKAFDQHYLLANNSETITLKKISSSE